MDARDLETRRRAACDAQALLARAEAPLAIMACPGAGKTRLIVDRHLCQAVPARQGRAIASFTRVAANEVHRRCSEEGRPDLLGHPHFIGTLDTFLWLHLVRPFLPADRPWRRLESWDDAPTEKRTFVNSQKPYALADVSFNFDPVRSTWSAAPGKTQGQLSGSWAWQACTVRAEREAAGYLTGDELRAHASTNLTAHGSKLGRLLSAKYAELVVDEAQDCSSLDLFILAELEGVGLPLILVADPDQAIYGFRGAATAKLNALATCLGIRALTSNWRSTATICQVAATLRRDPASRTPDIALAHHHDSATPVLVYRSGNPDHTTADFLAQAAAYGIDPGDCMVLSHSNSSLPKAYAGPGTPPSGSTAQLAWACGIIREFPAAPTKTRTKAFDILARTVLRWWYPGSDSAMTADVLEAQQIDSSDFARLLQHVADVLPALHQPMLTWKAGATNALNQAKPTPSARRAATRLTCRSTEARSARVVAGLPTPNPPGQTSPRLSSVHRVKGSQAGAVLMLMPNSARSTNTIQAWLAGQASDGNTAEALRVLYVAVTRAEKLLALAVPQSQMQAVVAHLTAHGVLVHVRP